LRVVLDTNVLLSALLFPSGRLVWLREAWMTGRFTPLIDRLCAEEVVRALTYPKFGLTQAEIETLLGDYLPYAETVATAGTQARELPECRDPHDVKFLVLAESGGADVLVTGDRALLDLAGKTRFAIEKPAACRVRLA
jgi:putative PIN family toxin of toxin-antitoxin system